MDVSFELNFWQSFLAQLLVQRREIVSLDRFPALERLGRVGIDRFDRTGLSGRRLCIHLPDLPVQYPSLAVGAGESNLL